jgi:protein gp37
VAEKTRISWTHHTFNPWRGCAKVSPGCAHCYAEAMAARSPAVLGEWGPGAARVVAAEGYWRQPYKWDREACEAGERRRVFCASLADVFEGRPDLAAPRERLWGLVRATPYLDWLLLSKRPENLGAMMPHGDWPNVWLGTSVEDRRRLGRVAQSAQVNDSSTNPRLAAPSTRAGVAGSLSASAVTTKAPASPRGGSIPRRKPCEACGGPCSKKTGK